VLQFIQLRTQTLSDQRLVQAGSQVRHVTTIGEPSLAAATDVANSGTGILHGMPGTTTIKVSTETRDALRRLADRDGLTLDAQLDKLIRRERRRIIGAQLASAPLQEDDVAVLDASASDVADASR
jgi:hypothetical protein